ncbi:hypothetical protein GE09DRAFT_1216462 [Coniochaeta sp. 2T2.1]|nr:hypothetical protein GE09DRAFT_1216462 [Coniochaeta sp. 2T2.1]
MRRIQRPRLTWPRRPRVSRLRLPRWRQTLADTEKQQTSILWVWAVRLVRALCLVSGTALAGATFWYGYDGYLDSKCMAEMQAWDNLINLLDYCNQEGNDISVRGTACENLNRQALPEPPSCVARGNTRPYMARPTFPPDLPSQPSVHQNVSRAEPTVQDPQRTGKLIVGGWDSTTPAGPSVTPAASKSSMSNTDASPTTLISRTLTITGHFTVPSTSAPTVIAVSDIALPIPSSLHPDTASDYDNLYSQYCSSVFSQNWKSGGWTAAHDELDDGDKPMYAQPTAGPMSSIVVCSARSPQAEQVHTHSFHIWGSLCDLLSTAALAVEDTVSQVLATGHLSPIQADWACAIVCAPIFVLAYALVMVFVARRYKRRRAVVLQAVEAKN